MRPAPASPLRRREREHEAVGLDPAEEIRLCRRWRSAADTPALTRLVEAHYGLVQRIANEFRNTGPERVDLVQEGHVGLVIAARRFDPSKSARLATYASYWIRACMMDLVVRSHGAVRVGTTRSQRRIFFGLGRARREIEGTGATVTRAALAERLNVTLKELDEMTPRLSGRDLSLDAPRRDDGPSVGAVLEGAEPSPEETVAGHQETHQRSTALSAAVAALPAREREILHARHLCDEPPTLAEMGARMGISRERVRQIEERALAMLRRALATACPAT